MTNELHLAAGPVNLFNGLDHRATDGSSADVVTNLTIQVQEGRLLTIRFECLSDPWVRENTYTEYNTDLWNQEVFEVFIAAGADQPGRYLEVELNPNNALFAAWVENPSGTDVTLLSKLRYEDARIAHQVKVGERQWSGELSIPLDLFEDSAVFRINFYRIVLKAKPESGDWSCDTENCEFLCWQSTLSGKDPAFHRPARFGYLYPDN